MLYSQFGDEVITAGIDLSLTSTGLCIGGQVSSIRSKLRGHQRLIEIRDELIKRLTEGNVEIVALEGYSFSSRFSHAHSIGELGGVVKVALAESGIKVVTIPPTNRAKFATGRGNASKDEVVAAVLSMTKIEKQPGLDDLCDAWVLEQMLRYILGERTLLLSDKQVAAVEAISYLEQENTDGI
ncbi:MAG: hypothetical protein EBT80_00160 [Chitinophagales bacterium]|nr:hypothetical protein [Chitinophagales bacterium]